MVPDAQLVKLQQCADVGGIAGPVAVRRQRRQQIAESPALEHSSNSSSEATTEETMSLSEEGTVSGSDVPSDNGEAVSDSDSQSDIDDDAGCDRPV